MPTILTNEKRKFQNNVYLILPIFDISDHNIYIAVCNKTFMEDIWKEIEEIIIIIISYFQKLE